MSENDRIKLIFDQFDQNKNGTIERTELYKLVVALNGNMTEIEVRDFFKDMDTDHSGQITFDEFIKYWTK
jgi:calcium-binding protein CML